MKQIRICVGLLIGCSLSMLAGCISHTRALRPVTGPRSVQSATLEQLTEQIGKRDESIQSLNLSITIGASVGGMHKGKVTDYASFSGYILLRKPGMLRVLGLVPVLHTRAFDMVSDGDNFKLLIPARNKAIVGSEVITQPSPNALENLRPIVFIESLLVASIKPDDFTYLAGDTEYEPEPETKRLLEIPEYDVGVLHRKAEGNQLQPSRIIKIRREDLLPYEQDIYDDNGDIVTEAKYSAYKDFSGTKFPTVIKIHRPKEEYEITITVTKLIANQNLANDQFELKIPEGTQIQQLH